MTSVYHVIHDSTKNYTIPIVNDQCRSIYDGDGRILDTITDTIPEPTTNESSEINENNLSLIYRYKFTQQFMDELYKFSKIHQYDDRKSFKETWELWTKDADDLIVSEMRRLQSLGYDGDIPQKMFKSARYYFRKKSTTKPQPKDRRKYVGVNKTLLDAMDAHILKNRKMDNYKPSEGFLDFCNHHKAELIEEINKLIENQLDSEEILGKIKKTYKNRYFMSITK